MTATAPSVLIVGGGPAGLTTAYRLALKGHRVTVLDRHAALGGPSSNLSPPTTILGCHRATWALFETLHQPAGIAIPLEWRLDDGRTIRYPDTWFPGPFRPLLNLLRWSAIPWHERRQLVSWLERIWEEETTLPVDLEQRTADEWLQVLGQTASTRKTVWNPLAQWLTGTDIQRLSADALAASLKPYFLQSRSDNQLTVLPQSVQEALLQPLLHAATQAGATVRFNTEVSHLRYAHEQVSGVQLKDGSILEADWYVMAVNPQQLSALLPERWLSRYAYFQQLAELTTIDRTVIQGIATVPSIKPRLILLNHHDFSALTLTGTREQTSFFLSATDQADPDAESRLAEFLHSLTLLPTGVSLTTTRRHTIPHAILPLPPGTKTRRPIQRSPVANLLVAGAWTDTGWPCNLESAIESGNRCAWAIQGQ